jgi:PilZ domain
LNDSEQDSSFLPTNVAKRRQHERRPLHSSVRITYCSDAAQSAQTGEGVDVSGSGISFESDAELDFYNLIRLEYTDEDGRNCCRRARLLYRANRRYGAFFVDTE